MAHYDIPHWPIVNRTTQFRPFYLLGNAIRELGLDAVISVKVDLDYHNSERYILYVRSQLIDHTKVTLLGLIDQAVISATFSGKTQVVHIDTSFKVISECFFNIGIGLLWMHKCHYY